MLTMAAHERNVYRNMALEERLLDAAPRLPVLFLYVDAPCVVIGKNQNPWCECHLSLMEKEGVAAARRISGGGAVYHDEGNLNVSVIVPRTEYRAEKQYELILQTLAGFGIAAERLNKNSLAVAGKKFSGHAFCHRRGRSLHHGTLLVNSDLDRLKRCLGPEIEGIETKAVTSIPSPVMNLCEAAPDLTVDKLADALREMFKEKYGSDGVVEYGGGTVADEELAAGIRKFSSGEWIFGHTPRFELEHAGRILTVEKGRIVNLDDAPPFEQWRKRHAADI